MVKHNNLRLLLICTLAAGVRLGLIALRWNGSPTTFNSGDYILYRIGGEHILTTHDLSNSLFLVRPPLFPALIAVLGLNDLLILIVNALIGSLAVLLTYTLTQRLGLTEHQALWAAFIVALDPTAIAYSAFLGPEALTNTLTPAAVVALLVAMQNKKLCASYAWSAIAGIALVLSAYARPSAYLLWIPLGAWLLITYRHRWQALALFALISVLGIGVWVVHNQRVFHYATFSTIGPYTMTYYRAASVEHVATGADMDTVYTRINQRVAELANLDFPIDAASQHHFLASSPAVAQALNQTSREIFTAHPLVYLATIPLGFARLYGLVTYSLAQSFGIPALAEIAWNMLFLSGTIWGMWTAWQRKRWLLLWGVLLIIVYYTTGTLLVKSAGMTTRERSVLTPWMAISFVYGAEDIYQRWRRHRTPAPE